jgi:hypothetical protein
VAIPIDPGTKEAEQVQPVVDFFNSHYEVYGRKIQLVPYESATLGKGKGFPDAGLQKADAAQVSRLNVFAALDFNFQYANSSTATLPEYVDGLAHHRIVSVNGGVLAPVVTSDQLRALAPYGWTYLPPVGDVMVQTALMTCAQLVGHNASHSPAMAAKRRKFGFVLPKESNYGGPVPQLPEALAILRSCGVTNPPIAYDDAPNEYTQPGLQAAFSKMKADGVTSLIYVPYGGFGGPGTTMSTANQVNYEPEWIIVSAGSFAPNLLGAEPENQYSHDFGVAGFNKIFPMTRSFWYRAFTEAGGNPSSAVRAAGAWVYRELLVLAAGIQTAGPQLTPASFATGLRQTVFPNPGAGAAPSWQARVGFPRAGDPMLRDYGGFWTAPGSTLAVTVKAQQSEGSEIWMNFCWAQLGRRWADQSWPAQDSFRTGPCR